MILCAVSIACLPAAPATAGAREDTPERIVSLAPSTTEILFALGLGHRVVGVTRYCDYPQEAKNVARVGGFLDPNYEEIIALRPDLVILLVSHRDARRDLKKMKVPTLTVPHETVRDIHESIRLIGAACGRRTDAAAMVADLDARAAAVRDAVGDAPRPRVLICIGRDTRSGSLAGMYMAGRHGFYDEIIEAAGGANAYTDGSVAFPQVSAEGVITLNPDIIIDLKGNMNPGGDAARDISRQWDRLHVVTAVRTGRVHVIEGDHALRPGPRYIPFLEELARLIHPESFRGEAARD